MAIFATLASTRLASILVQEIFAMVKQINGEEVTVLLGKVQVRFCLTQRPYLQAGGYMKMIDSEPEL